MINDPSRLTDRPVRLFKERHLTFTINQSINQFIRPQKQEADDDGKVSTFDYYLRNLDVIICANFAMMSSVRFTVSKTEDPAEDVENGNTLDVGPNIEIVDCECPADHGGAGSGTKKYGKPARDKSPNSSVLMSVSDVKCQYTACSAATTMHISKSLPNKYVVLLLYNNVEAGGQII